MCFAGILAMYGWNYWTIQQVIGRLLRMGQKGVVVWFILVCCGTYALVLEDKMCRKIVPEILYTGRIPAWIGGSRIRRMVAFD